MSTLTPEQRAIVEADDGPVVVIAGAGTGKTRVIVERVRWLLETKGAVGPGTGGLVPAEPTPRHGNPFEGPLVPEQLLVLTYNVKAAKELQERLDSAVGPATRARMTVSNFHSFCQHVLTESSGDAGLPAARTSWTASASSSCSATCARSWTCATTATTPSRTSWASSAGPRTSWSRRTTTTASWPRSAGSTRSATGASRRRACAWRPRATSSRCARCAAPTRTSARTSAPRTPASCASTTPACS